MMIDMGFNGEKVTVFKNNGFIFIENNLAYSSLSRIPCKFDKCPYVGKSQYETHFNLEGHNYVPVVRNEISLQLNIPNDNVYNVILRNVNYVNHDPCQIAFIIQNKSKLNTYSGPIIKQYENDNDVAISNLKSNQCVKKIN